MSPSHCGLHRTGPSGWGMAEPLPEALYWLHQNLKKRFRSLSIWNSEQRPTSGSVSKQTSFQRSIASIWHSATTSTTHRWRSVAEAPAVSHWILDINIVILLPSPVTRAPSHNIESVISHYLSFIILHVNVNGVLFMSWPQRIHVWLSSWFWILP